MIHYHGLPMYPQPDMVRAFPTKHAMASFEAPEQIEVAAEICQSIVLDNGAFSAWRQGKPYDFGGYYAWAAKWLGHPAVEWGVIPDVIDGSEADNDALLCEWPLPRWLGRGVPVYHMHESIERLSRLAAAPHHISQSGRTSIAPCEAPGHFAAQDSAWSRSGTSIVK